MIKSGELHEKLGERFDAAGKLHYKSVELGEESVSIGKKILEKQDETTNEIRGLREDLNRSWKSDSTG